MQLFLPSCPSNVYGNSATLADENGELVHCKIRMDAEIRGWL